MRSQQEVLKEITTPESGKKRYRESMAKLLAMRSPFAMEAVYEKRARLRGTQPVAVRNLNAEFESAAVVDAAERPAEQPVAAGVRMRRV